MRIVVVKESSNSGREIFGQFKTIADAQAFIKASAEETKEMYKHSDPTIMESWEHADTVLELFIHDRFESTDHKFSWTIENLMKPQFTF